MARKKDTPPSLETLLTTLRTGSDEERENAVEAIGRRRIRKIHPELIAALTDINPNVRWLTALLIGSAGLTPALRHVIALCHDCDEEVRCRAVESVGSLLRNAELAPEEIITALQDSSSLVRCSAAEALGEIGDRKACSALSDALDDADPLVRACVAGALGETGCRASTSVLERALKIETDEGAMEAELRSLFVLGVRGSVWPRYLQLLDSDDYHVRCAIANSIHLLIETPTMAAEAVSAMRTALSRSPERAAKLALRSGIKRVQKLYPDLEVHR